MTTVLFENTSVFDGRTPHLLENHHVLVENGSTLPVIMKAGHFHKMLL